MKTQMKLVLALLTAFLLLECVSRLAAQETNAPRRRQPLNPSQAFPPVNPSEVVPPVNPSRTFPPVNPSRNLPPLGPSRTVPGGLADPPAQGPAPVVPNLELTQRVFIAVTEGVERFRGQPVLPGARLDVDALRVDSDRGRVILTGAVASQRDKREAGLRAEEIAGRGNVVNRLTVVTP